MQYALQSIFSVAMMVGGVLLIFQGAGDPQQQSLAIAGSILVAAAYLGGPEAPGQWPRLRKNSSATEEKLDAKNWPRLQ
jgi:hypothetical protein